MSGWTPTEEAALVEALARYKAHRRALASPAAQIIGAAGWLYVARYVGAATRQQPSTTRSRRNRSAAECKNRAKALCLV